MLILDCLKGEKLKVFGDVEQTDQALKTLYVCLSFMNVSIIIQSRCQSSSLEWARVGLSEGTLG